MGYSLYAGSLWAFQLHHNKGFVIAASASEWRVG
jgi:hypothetical protein